MPARSPHEGTSRRGTRAISAAVLPEQFGEVTIGLLLALAVRRVAVATAQFALPVSEDLRGLDHVSLGSSGNRDDLTDPALVPVVCAHVLHKVDRGGHGRNEAWFSTSREELMN